MPGQEQQRPQRREDEPDEAPAPVPPVPRRRRASTTTSTACSTRSTMFWKQMPRISCVPSCKKGGNEGNSDVIRARWKTV